MGEYLEKFYRETKEVYKEATEGNLSTVDKLTVGDDVVGNNNFIVVYENDEIYSYADRNMTVRMPGKALTKATFTFNGKNYKINNILDNEASRDLIVHLFDSMENLTSALYLTKELEKKLTR